MTVNDGSLLLELIDGSLLLELIEALITRRGLKIKKDGDKQLPIQLSPSSCYQFMKTKEKIHIFNKLLTDNMVIRILTLFIEL